MLCHIFFGIFTSVNSKMFEHVTLLRELLGTFTATVGFLSSVNSPMKSKIAWLLKCFRTLGTVLRFLPTVQCASSDVLVYCTVYWRILHTVSCWKVSPPCMDSKMPLQRARKRKNCWTLWTTKRLLTRMDSHLQPQILCSSERFCTCQLYSFPKLWEKLWDENIKIKSKVNEFNKSLKDYFQNKLSLTVVCTKAYCPSCKIFLQNRI